MNLKPADGNANSPADAVILQEGAIRGNTKQISRRRSEKYNVRSSREVAGDVCWLFTVSTAESIGYENTADAGKAGCFQIGDVISDDPGGIGIAARSLKK